MAEPLQSEVHRPEEDGSDRPITQPTEAETPRRVTLTESERPSPSAPGPRVVKSGSRVFAKPGATPSESHSGLQRTVSAIRTVVPAIQKLLPLLDGNVVLAVANLLAPRPQVSRAEMAPVEDGLARLRSEHMELHSIVEQQTAALKRLDSQLTTVKDVSERTVQEQRELSGDVEGLRNKVTVFSLIGLFLLVVSIALNVILLFRVGQITH